jgi:hypothetical protein
MLSQSVTLFSLSSDSARFRSIYRTILIDVFRGFPHSLNKRWGGTLNYATATSLYILCRSVGAILSELLIYWSAVKWAIKWTMKTAGGHCSSALVCSVRRQTEVMYLNGKWSYSSVRCKVVRQRSRNHVAHFRSLQSVRTRDKTPLISLIPVVFERAVASLQLSSHPI